MKKERKTRKREPLKACYGSYAQNRSCSGCVYHDSCALYTGTANTVDRGSGLVSFDNTVDLWYPAPDKYIPGYEETTDQHAEMVSAVARMLKWIMELDSYTLGIVAEIIAPSKSASGGVSVAHLARLRNCSRQAMHEKMVYAVARFPELGGLFQTALRRVGNLKSKFQRYARKQQDAEQHP